MWKVKKPPRDQIAGGVIFDPADSEGQTDSSMSDSMDLHFEVEFTGSYDLGEVKKGRGGRYWYIISRSKKYTSAPCKHVSWLFLGVFCGYILNLLVLQQINYKLAHRDLLLSRWTTRCILLYVVAN